MNQRVLLCQLWKVVCALAKAFPDPFLQDLAGPAEDHITMKCVGQAICLGTAERATTR